MDERNKTFDFMPLGRAIKKAREAKGTTREQVAEIVDYSIRHIQSVENEGHFPSIELFFQLVTMFDVSVDECIYADKKATTSSTRRRLDTLLDKLNDNELSVIEATANGLCKAKEAEE
jgi:transcriptional regulator with XRE-family HTH domain